MAVNNKIQNPKDMANRGNTLDADLQQAAALRHGDRLTEEEMALRRLRAKARMHNQDPAAITPEQVAQEKERQAGGLPPVETPRVIRTKPPLVHTKRRCEKCEWREESLLTGGTYCMDGEFTVPADARKDEAGLTVCVNERMADE